MEVEDDEGTTKENETRRSRKQVPLRLAWAWTIWKNRYGTTGTGSGVGSLVGPGVGRTVVTSGHTSLKT